MDCDFDFSGNVNVGILHSHKSAKQFRKNHNGENHSVINLSLLEPSWNPLKETEIHKYLAYSNSYCLINQPLNNVHKHYHRFIMKN